MHQKLREHFAAIPVLPKQTLWSGPPPPGRRVVQERQNKLPRLWSWICLASITQLFAVDHDFSAGSYNSPKEWSWLPCKFLLLWLFDLLVWAKLAKKLWCAPVRREQAWWKFVNIAYSHDSKSCISSQITTLRYVSNQVPVLLRSLVRWGRDKFASASGNQ